VACLLPAAPALAAPDCRFILGFAALQAMDPADVGTCLDNQASAANGDAIQHTSKGLMAWRKSDNWTAFTDGYQTWINGPDGLAERLNTKRFTWEANDDGPEGIGTDGAPVSAPAPPVTCSTLTAVGQAQVQVAIADAKHLDALLAVQIQQDTLAERRIPNLPANAGWYAAEDAQIAADRARMALDALYIAKDTAALALPAC
jgi:hypothetical protein